MDEISGILLKAHRVGDSSWDVPLTQLPKDLQFQYIILRDLLENQDVHYTVYYDYGRPTKPYDLVAQVITFTKTLDIRIMNGGFIHCEIIHRHVYYSGGIQVKNFDVHNPDYKTDFTKWMNSMGACRAWPEAWEK